MALALEVEGVRKAYGKQAVLERIDLQLQPGQAMALCGGNGAGKSTLLRMIAGIEQPTSGSIRVDGLSWRGDRRRYAERIGYMPDDYRFGQGLSALETLSFWASLRKVGPSRIAELLDRVGLSDVKHKLVSSFSKGMRQRLLFAQALLARPSLLVLDEPTNGLDPYWMHSFVELVGMAKQEGVSVLFSTHQLDIADAAADRLAFLKEGRIDMADTNTATATITAESFRSLYERGDRGTARGAEQDDGPGRKLPQHQQSEGGQCETEIGRR